MYDVQLGEAWHPYEELEEDPIEIMKEHQK